jgi:Holliday junction resolvase
MTSHEEHDNMVRQIAKLHQDNNFDVQVAIDGQRPDSTPDNFIPDVIAKREPFFLVYEVETSDTWDTAHSQQQWESFAKYAKNHSGTFYIVVPNNLKSDVESRLSQLAEDNKIFDYIKVMTMIELRVRVPIIGAKKSDNLL